MPRAVVTGLGAVTCLGHDVPTFWDALTAGRRGVGRITRFDPTGLRNENAGQVWDWEFSPDAFGLASPPDLATQFLLHAVREAACDAGLVVADDESGRAGTVLATNFGGGMSWERFVAQAQAGEAAAEAFGESVFGAASDHVCRGWNLAGPAELLSIACASGSAALGTALDLIRHGRADVVICGGHDALAPSPLAGLSVLRTMSADDILPFSANRSGTLFGEGAAALVVESLQRAQARGARVYCEILGSWQDNNAHHLTAPDPGGNGMIRVLAEALADAGLEPRALDYINAHGTGTEYHDPEETHAIKAVLGAHARAIPVSSIKGATGHLMGAAGVLEAVATVKAIQTGVVPPTLNDGAVDPEMDLDFVVNAARAHEVRVAASISAGIGGSNACVVMGKVDGDGGERHLTPLPPLLRTRRSGEAEKCRAVVTGLAPICAVGIGRVDFWEGLAEGREGRRAPERIGDGRFERLAECLDFVVEDYLESEKTYLDRCSALLLAACRLGFDDAGLDWRGLDRERTCLAVGTAFGCLESMQNVTARVQAKGVRFASPMIFTHSFANSPGSLAAIEYGIAGPAPTFSAGDASSANALRYALDLLRAGRASVALAGGVEALSEVLLAGLADRASVPGEGACLLVLETADAAAARGATPLAELAGVGYGANREAALRAACLDSGLAGAEAFAAPETYGHTFGAGLALDVAAAVRRLGEGDAPEALGVIGRESGGRAAAAVVRQA